MEMSPQQMTAFFAVARLIHSDAPMGVKQVGILLETYTPLQLELAVQIMESPEHISLRLRERMKILKEAI